MITPADKAHLHSSDGSSSSTSASDTRTLGVQASKVMRDVQDLGSIAADTVGQTTGRLKAQGREYIEAGRERACKLKGDVAVRRLQSHQVDLAGDRDRCPHRHLRAPRSLRPAGKAS